MAPQGPSASDLSSQAAATQALAAAVQQLAAAYTQGSAAAANFSTQSTDITDAFDEIESAMDGANRANEKFRQSIESQIEGIETLSDAARVASNMFKRMGKEGKGMASALAFAAGAAKGMASGFRFTVGLTKSFLGGVKSMIGAVFDLGAAILSLPFKLWDKLLGMGKGGGGGGGGGGTELLEALEKVRETFGDIRKDAGRAVVDIAKGLAGWGKIMPGLAAGTMRTSLHFGSLADAIEYVMKLVGPATVLFSSLIGQFATTGKNVFIMAKGLGVGEEEFAGLMNMAKATGETVENIEVEMTKFAKGLSAEFGLTSKLMSRDMAKAMKDVKHFANTSVKEIAKATAYAHSLGMELKDITGILDAFNTFDQAAENVSKLSQAFGVNIDVMKLVEAKTPDEALRMVKDSFTAAGKSAENMNRQELQLLASTVGMSEEAVRLGLSSKNQAISMNKLAQTTDGLAKKTMTASEATNLLKDDIERVIKSGGGGGGGGPESNSLLGAFAEGILQGVTQTKEFRKIMMNIKRDFMVVTLEGRLLGRAIVDMFPGLRKFLDGLGDILSPDKIGGLFRSYRKTFEDFMKGLKSGADVKQLVEGLVKNFTDYLTKSGPGGQKMLQGLKEFWSAAKAIIASAINYLGDLLQSGLNTLIDVIDGKYSGKVNSALGKTMSETAPILSAFTGLFEKIKGPAGALFDKFMSWAASKLGEVFKEHWGKIMLYMVGPSLVAGLGSGLASLATQRLVQGPVVGQLKKIAGIMESQGAQIGQAGGQMAGGLAQGAGGAGTMVQGYTSRFMKQSVALKGLDVTADLLSFKVKAEIMLGAMKDLMQIVKSADLDPEKFKQVETLIKAAMDFYTRLRLLDSVQGIVAKLPTGAGAGGGVGGTKGMLAQAGVQLVGMAAAVGAMLVATHQILSFAANTTVDEKKVDVVIKALEASSKLFIDASIIMGAATLLAAFTVFTKGVSFIAQAIGFGEIFVAVEAILFSAKQMINAIDNTNVDAGTIETKVNSFVAITRLIVDITKATSGLMDSLPLTMFSDANKIEKAFTGAQGLVNSIIGGPGGGLMAITQLLLQFINDVPAKKMEAAAGIGAVLSGAAQMFGALTQGVAALQATHEVGVFGVKASSKGIGVEKVGLQDSAGVISQLDGLRKFFVDIVGAINNSLIQPLSTAMRNVRKADVEKMGAMGQLLGSVLTGMSQMFSALAGPMKDFRSKHSESTDVLFGLASVNETFDNFDANAFDRFAGLINSLGPMLSESMPKLIQGVSAAAVTAAAGIGKKDIEGVKAVIDLMNAASQIMQALSGAAKDKQVSVTSAPKVDMSGVQKGITVNAQSVANIEIILPDLTKVLDAMSTKLPEMITGVLKAAKDVKVEPSQLKSLESLGAVFKGMSEMIRILTETIIPAMKTSDVPGGGAFFMQVDPAETAATMKRGFEVFDELLTQITQTSGGAGGTTVSLLQSIVNKAGNLPKIPADAVKNVNQTKEFFESISKITESMGAEIITEVDWKQRGQEARKLKDAIDNPSFIEVFDPETNTSTMVKKIEKVATPAIDAAIEDAKKVKRVTDVTATKASITDRLDGIKAQVEALSGPSVDGLITAAGTLKTKTAGQGGGLTAAAAAAKSFFDAINTLTEAFDSFSVETVGGGGVFSTLSNLPKMLFGGDAAGPPPPSAADKMGDKLKSIQGQIDALTAQDSGVSSLITKANSLNTALANVGALQTAGTGATKFFDGLDALADSMQSGMANATGKGIAGIGENIKKHVEAMVKAVNEFQSGLAKIGSSAPAKISVALGGVANSLGVKDQMYQVTRGDINFKIDLTVNMDAQSIEAGIVGANSVIVNAFTAVQDSGAIRGVGAGLRGVTKNKTIGGDNTTETKKGD